MRARGRAFLATPGDSRGGPTVGTEQVKADPRHARDCAVEISRRQVLQAGSLAAAGAAVGQVMACSEPTGDTTRPGPASATTAAPRTLMLTGAVTGSGTYLYLPFAVPAGVSRIDVSMTRSDSDAQLGIGLFDQRGPDYQSAGFRGVFGAERSAFFVSAMQAQQSFLPGPIEAGTWTVVVPVFSVPRPSDVTVKVTMTSEPQSAAFQPGPQCGVVVDAPGWYRGDLHCHTPESSDAWTSGTALSPAGWAEACRRTGLDFIAVTDHNVVSGNLNLARDAGRDVLLMPGEEMTNWAWGHATVSGIDPGEWLDWRQAPAGKPLPRYGRSISEFIRVAEGMGAYVAAAHPRLLNIRWQFQQEAEIDPAARCPGFEAWGGVFQADDQLSVQTWDGMLQKGFRVWANGGSDLHGVDNNFGLTVGTPTTVVYAEALSKEAVVAGLKAGRMFVTRIPDGVECYVTARKGDQRTAMGGTIFGGVGDLVEVSFRVRRAGGLDARLHVISAGNVIEKVPIASDDQTVTRTVPIPPNGTYVRAEVRSHPHPNPAHPLGSALDMECLTNPVWLQVGDVPPGTQPFDAPPPARPGPRRVSGG